VLDLTLTTPKELGGNGAVGTNPEQLFAAGYSACFIGALKFVAGKAKVALPADTHRRPCGHRSNPDRLRHRGRAGDSPAGPPARPGRGPGAEAHIVCLPNATRGNIDVTLTVRV
jgi:organic hydroperoxide reductase OsmC/OhrA